MWTSIWTNWSPGLIIEKQHIFRNTLTELANAEKLPYQEMTKAT